MIRTVWKFILTPGQDEILHLVDPHVVHVGNDPIGGLCMWVEHTPNAGLGPRRRFIIIGTGHPRPAAGVHVGSAVCPPYVWHVYQEDDH